MPDVHSKALKSVRHGKMNLELRVYMHDGTQLCYKQVPREVYHELLDAPSVGQYYNAHVRDRYAFEYL